MKFLLLTVVICLIYAVAASPLIEGEEGEDQDAFQRIAAVPTVHAVMDLHVPT
ncbi:14349_t:CDS:2, partial [Funneliformis caledonium]